MSREKTGPLYLKNIYPPLSILNQNSGYWQSRKNEWLNLGIQSELGREGVRTFNTTKLIDKIIEEGNSYYQMSTISTFDPFLCELSYQWFSPHNGIVFDPFAGGSVRGIVASILGREYVGIELSQKQVEANIQQLPIVKGCKSAPRWITDDSENLDKYLDTESVDYIFTCPPYHDLEKYSDDERDLSNMSYDQFIDKFKKIMVKSFQILKRNRFASIVVTELRDHKNDGYKNFVGDTINAFEEAGFVWYNDIIIEQTTGSKALVAQKMWDVSRKITRRHQNFLTFVKGDSKIATQHLGEISKIDLNKISTKYW